MGYRLSPTGCYERLSRLPGRPESHDEPVFARDARSECRVEAGMTFVIDPRRGDVEDDASSTKQRSMLSLAGSLLAEISLPKLVVAWVLLIGAPAVLIGIAPLALSIWIATASSKAAYALSGIGSLLLFAVILAVELVRRTPSLADGRGELLVAQFTGRATGLRLGSRAPAPCRRKTSAGQGEHQRSAKSCAQEWPRWRVWRFSFPLSSWSCASGRRRCGSERSPTSRRCGGSSPLPPPTASSSWRATSPWLRSCGAWLTPL